MLGLSLVIPNVAVMGSGLRVPYPAPDGYRWQQVVFGGVPVVYLNQPVFALELIQ